MGEQVRSLTECERNCGWYRERTRMYDEAVEECGAAKARLATLEAEVGLWKHRAERDSDKLDAVDAALHPVNPTAEATAERLVLTPTEEPKADG